jgi:hypothetical protein
MRNLKPKAIAVSLSAGDIAVSERGRLESSLAVSVCSQVESRVVAACLFPVRAKLLRALVVPRGLELRKRSQL